MIKASPLKTSQMVPIKAVGSKSRNYTCCSWIDQHLRPAVVVPVLYYVNRDVSDPRWVLGAPGFITHGWARVTSAIKRPPENQTEQSAKRHRTDPGIHASKSQSFNSQETSAALEPSESVTIGRHRSEDRTASSWASGTRKGRERTCEPRQ